MDELKEIRFFSLLAIKSISSIAVAYVLSFVGKEFMNYGSFSFAFIFISVFVAFFYFLKNQKFLGLIIVDASLIAIALLLRFYVILAYGS